MEGNGDYYLSEVQMVTTVGNLFFNCQLTFFLISLFSDGLDLLGLLGIETDIHVHKILSCRYLYNLCIELAQRAEPQGYCEELLIEGSDHSLLFTK